MLPPNTPKGRAKLTHHLHVPQDWSGSRKGHLLARLTSPPPLRPNQSLPTPASGQRLEKSSAPYSVGWGMKSQHTKKKKLKIHILSLLTTEQEVTPECNRQGLGLNGMLFTSSQDEYPWHKTPPAPHSYPTLSAAQAIKQETFIVTVGGWVDGRIYLLFFWGGKNFVIFFLNVFSY